MKVYCVLHRPYGEECEAVDAVRLTVEEADAYIAEHDDNRDRDEWRRQEIEMPLALAREMVTQ